jgi:adhesin transport system membrane fusion protein
VRPGQQATVKVTTYDFSRYGGLVGRVERIGAGSQVDSTTGGSYFEVVIKTDKNHLGDDSNALQISPGMEAVVDIHTGTRTVMDFLLKPVVKVKNEAFRER